MSSEMLLCMPPALPSETSATNNGPRGTKYPAKEAYGRYKEHSQ